MTYEFHRIANLFPRIPENERRELGSSIKNVGQFHKITLFEGKILEGRERYTACLEVGVEPQFQELPPGIDPYEFVAAENLRRRHLTVGQRAIIASEMANLKHGGSGANQYQSGAKVRKRSLAPNGGSEVAVKEAAAALKVGKTSVYEVRKLKKTDPEKYEKVQAGKVPLGHTGGPRNSTSKAKAPKKPSTLDNLPPFKGLTKEQVDPDFKGTAQDFVDKYGLVQLMTKAQKEEHDDKATFSAWIAAFRALKIPLRDYLKVGKFSVENYNRFIALGNKERKISEMKELADMVTRTKESIDWLLELLRAE